MVCGAQPAKLPAHTVCIMRLPAPAATRRSTHPGRRERQYLLQLFLKCTAASQRAEWSASLLARISCGRCAAMGCKSTTQPAAVGMQVGAGNNAASQRVGLAGPLQVVATNGTVDSHTRWVQATAPQARG